MAEISVTMFLYILLASCFVNTLGIDYLDTESLIVRRSPNDNAALFGYSATLHSLDISGGIDNMRLMVGAPLQVQPSNFGTMQPTGAVFNCGLTDDDETCTVVNQTSFYTFNDADFGFNDNKTQLLGISVFSAGNSFVACSPRMRTNYTAEQMRRRVEEINDVNDFSIPPYENMPGRCFIGDRSLQNFNEYNYCHEMIEVRISAGLDQCNFGTSLTGAMVGSEENNFVFGMPTSLALSGSGAFLYTTTNGSAILQEQQSRGTRFVVSPNHRLSTLSICSEVLESSLYSYDGFAVAVGHITDTTKLDIISAQPRYNTMNVLDDSDLQLPTPRIRGLVRVASEVLDLGTCERYNYTSHLYGETPTEYFGWSLVALDLTGDGYDELLVGAPLYSYVKGTLNCLDCGRVFVYRNNRTGLEFKKHLFGTIPFGRFSYAMTSVGDINHDGCDDFVVSAPFSRTGDESGTIYLYLGAGSLELVSDAYTQSIVGSELNGLASVTSFGSSLSSGYDVDSNTYDDLVIGAGFSETVVVLRTRPIFQVYTNMTTSSSILTFANPNCGLSGGNEPLDGLCFNVTFVIEDVRKGVTADYNITYSLTLDADVQSPLLFVDSSLRESVATGTMTLGPSKTVETITHNIYIEANENIVSRNALITLDVVADETRYSGAPSSLLPTILPVSQSVSRLTVFLNASSGCFASSSCQNDLMLAKNNVVATGSETQNGSIIVVNITRTVAVSVDFISSTENVSCVQTYVSNSEALRLTEVTEPQDAECMDDLCFTSNVGRNKVVKMTFTFAVESYPDDHVFVVFNASSGCAEVNETTNVLRVEIPVRRITDLSIRIVADPDQNSFVPLSDSTTDLNLALESDSLEFNVTFTIRNIGPSDSPFSTITIYWPLTDPAKTDQFFLYPLSIRTEDSNITCGMEHINPNNVDLNLRRRRQSSQNSQVPTEFWSCAADQQSDCAQIHCNVTGLSRGQFGRIIIRSRGDLRTFTRRGRSSQWQLELYAEVTSVDSQGDDRLPNMATDRVLIFPDIQDIPLEEDDDDIPIWLIIIAIVVAILLIIIIGVILYCCGFCRRKKQTDEEADEEKQKWVSASSTGTPDLSRENSMRTRTLTDDDGYRATDEKEATDNVATVEDTNKEKESIGDDKSSPPESTEKEDAAPESSEKDAQPESNEDAAPPEKDENNVPPDTNKDNGIAESNATGEGTNNSTTVELECQETDL